MRLGIHLRYGSNCSARAGARQCGSLTVIGSAAGVMVMSLDKSYSFGKHLKFLPAILTNFLCRRQCGMCNSIYWAGTHNGKPLQR